MEKIICLLIVLLAVPAFGQATKFGHEKHKEHDEATLIEVGDYYGRTERLAPEAAVGFIKMRQAAAAEGIDLSIISGFRSIEDQKYLFNQQKARKGGAAEAAKTSAPPGYSEHHSGNAIDIGDSKFASADLQTSFEFTPAFKWLQKNAGDYGFKLSFPEGNQQGVSYEPWHWYFTGSGSKLPEIPEKPEEDTSKTGLGIPNLSALCTSCDSIERIMELIDSIGEKVYNSIRKGVLSIIGLMIAFGLMFNAIKLLFPFTAFGGVSNLYNQMVSRTGIALIVALFISSFGNYWGYIFQPIATAGVNFSGVLMKESSDIMLGTQDDRKAILKDKFTCDEGSNEIIKTSTDGQRLGKALSCALSQMQKTIGLGVEMSIRSMFAGLEEKETTTEDRPEETNNEPVIISGTEDAGFGDIDDTQTFDKTKTLNIVSNIYAAILSFFMGALLLWFYGKIFLMFPVRIADVVIRWMIMTILSPLMLAALILPPTRGFAFAGLKSLMQGALELMMTALVIALGSVAIVTIIENQDTGTPFIASTIMFWQFLLVGYCINHILGNIHNFATVLAGSDLSLTPLGEKANEVAQTATRAVQSGGGDMINTIKSRLK